LKQAGDFPNRRQANEVADSPFCHKGSLLFGWEHVVTERLEKLFELYTKMTK
jgi:hypothetical protein